MALTTKMEAMTSTAAYDFGGASRVGGGMQFASQSELPIVGSDPPPYITAPLPKITIPDGVKGKLRSKVFTNRDADRLQKIADAHAAHVQFVPGQAPPRGAFVTNIQYALIQIGAYSTLHKRHLPTSNWRAECNKIEDAWLSNEMKADQNASIFGKDTAELTLAYKIEYDIIGSYQKKPDDIVGIKTIRIMDIHIQHIESLNLWKTLIM